MKKLGTWNSELGTIFGGQRIFGFGNWDLILSLRAEGEAISQVGLTFGFGILHMIMVGRRNLHFAF